MTGTPSIVFLHGQDSSGQGTKGRFLRARVPNLLAPDFAGSLDDRMRRMEDLLAPVTHPLILVGSSFGGLMAAAFAIRHPDRLRRLVLLAPAFDATHPSPLPSKPLDMPVFLCIGQRDSVTPPAVVLPVARRLFSCLEIREVDDDHLLHAHFRELEWASLLS